MPRGVEWPTEIKNNSLAYIMSLLDAKTEENKNTGIQEKSEKTVYGLNAFNMDVTLPHAASVGTSIVGTLITIAILYLVYVLCRWCWRRHEAQKEARRQAMLHSLQAQLGGNPPNHHAMQAAHAALQGASHVPGAPGALAGAAAAALNQLGSTATPSAPSYQNGSGGTTYPILPGYAK